MIDKHKYVKRYKIEHRLSYVNKCDFLANGADR